jgi:REP element-mobilizing transposase RayT
VNKFRQPHRVAPTVAEQMVLMPNEIAKNLILGDVVGWFKTMTTHEYIRGVKQLGWLPFYKHFWQHDYYERIIRSEKELNAVRLYIQEKPAKLAEGCGKYHVKSLTPFKYH